MAGLVPLVSTWERDRQERERQDIKGCQALGVPPKEQYVKDTGVGRLSICPSNGKDDGYHIERTMMIILTWNVDNGHYTTI